MFTTLPMRVLTMIHPMRRLRLPRPSLPALRLTAPAPAPVPVPVRIPRAR